MSDLIIESKHRGKLELIYAVLNALDEPQRMLQITYKARIDNRTWQQLKKEMIGRYLILQNGLHIARTSKGTRVIELLREVKVMLP